MYITATILVSEQPRYMVGAKNNYNFSQIGHFFLSVQLTAKGFESKGSFIALRSFYICRNVNRKQTQSRQRKLLKDFFKTPQRRLKDVLLVQTTFRHILGFFQIYFCYLDGFATIEVERLLRSLFRQALRLLVIDITIYVGGLLRGRITAVSLSLAYENRQLITHFAAHGSRSQESEQKAVPEDRGNRAPHPRASQTERGPRDERNRGGQGRSPAAGT